MRKLQVESTEATRMAIRQEMVRSKESRYDHRLHGVLLVMAGQSCRQVAELFGEDGTTVQRWIHRFKQGGLDALREGERSGRPRTLDTAQWHKIQSDLRRNPQDFGLSPTLWDGLALSEHLRRRYGVELGLRQCQRLFRRMGFQLRGPSCEVPQDNLPTAAAQEKAALPDSVADVQQQEPASYDRPARKVSVHQTNEQGATWSPNSYR